MAIRRLNTSLFVATALAVWAGAQAQQSATAPAGAASAVASPTGPKAVTDKATATESARAAAAAKRAADADAVLLRDARNAGFTAENVNGARMFCRLENETGSSFLVKTCYDELQVRIKIEQYQTERNELEAIHHIQ